MTDGQDEISQAFGDAIRFQADDMRECPGCGTSVRDLYSDGRMGCARCYDAFGDIIQRALVVLHGANRHIGKTL